MIPEYTIGLILCVCIIIFISVFIAYNQKQSVSNYANPNSPWIRTQLDEQARLTNSCSVKRRESDSFKGVEIEIVDDTCEDGLPHTSNENTIRMTESVWKSPGKDSTLTHERVHIQQKRNPDKWTSFYKKYWNYILPTSPPSSAPTYLIARMRGNPDTADTPWVCWNQRYWFFPLYTSLENPTIRDTEIHVWDSRTGRVSKEPPVEWKSQFCTPSGECPVQWEHPHELAAEYITHNLSSPAAFTLQKYMH